LSGEELKARAERYLHNVERALQTIKISGREAQRIVEAARSYSCDAAYYLGSGEYVTSIACSSYAEGLLDSLRMLELASFEWPKSPPPVVLVGGVFEIIHAGHLYLLRRARELGRVFVVVARDATVEQLKGRRPVVPEEYRLEVVKSIRYVDDARLGSVPIDVRGTLQSVKPDIVLLGPDQQMLEQPVREAVRELGLHTRIIVLGERVGGANLSSSSIISGLFSRRP